MYIEINQGVGAFMVWKIRIPIAKPRLDEHNGGAKVIARAMKDAGIEGDLCRYTAAS
jgi:methylmalonyl-CoA mutase cobalamin-binding domain/chain